ncbi:MAG: amino acid permease [Deltaproteobacteria bacterium]|nr:amino acid permease [Deltaproteobacteria bacterium]MBW2537215.1 amino acid permease [Deltaproteobacteria bacterium]
MADLPSKPGEPSFETELSRDMGLTTALAIGVGTMIAAGIFTLSGLAVRNVGSAAVVAFLLAAVVAVFTALTYCEFSAAYPETGEGYLYARRTFPPVLAYAVGWCLVLGYTSSCAFYVASLSTYFQEFVWHAPFQAASGVVALIALTLLNVKGTKESGVFQVVVTGGKVALLLWFISGGLGAVDVDGLVAAFEKDVVKIGATAAMVFITFFGFSAIAASAGEVKNPVKTIPRAIFISMGLVTLLYTLVVLVVLAAGLTEYTEAAMGNAAKQFLGPIGGLVIVAGALFSMISASNASIMAGSRVVMAMSRLGQLPQAVGIVNPRTHTPIIALLLVGLTILVFLLLLPLEDLAHFADTVLLSALILVNAALIWNRRKFPNLHRPFRVPLVPVLPVLGIGANLYLIVQISHHLLPMVLAFGAVGVGMVFYFVSRSPAREAVPLVERPSLAPEPIAAEEGKPFRVLVPIAHPAHVDFLIDLAAAVAKDQEAGELVVLRVVRVPEQDVPRLDDEEVARQQAILDVARKRARQHGLEVASVVRLAHRIEGAILETAAERLCDLIVLGWKGFTSTAGRILGDVTDSVVRHAPCDILLAKPVGSGLPKHMLLPTAGGPHAQRAEHYAASLCHAQSGTLAICSVLQPDASQVRVEAAQQSVNEAVDRIGRLDGVSARLIRHESVTDGIQSAAEDYDAVVLGAAGDPRSKQLLFGNIPEKIAEHTDRTVLMVKRHPDIHPRRPSWKETGSPSDAPADEGGEPEPSSADGPPEP